MQNPDLTLIANQVAFHTEFITDLHRVFDYSYIKLYNTNSNTLVSPPDLMRRGNDILAAAYAHALAIDQQSGDDCIDAKGNTLELKLAFIKSDGLSLGDNLNIRRGTKQTLTSAVAAKFKVYPGTAKNHHEKDTAFILMSYDHNCFITGFVMKGSVIQPLLESNKTSINRAVSLNQFMKYGTEFSSSVPHIGWARYYSCLQNYLAAVEGRYDETKTNEALTNWASLANLHNLTKL